MATALGKAFTAISFIYRSITLAGAGRVLFLVDRGNSGDQTPKEFHRYASSYNDCKFTEECAVHGCTNAASGQEPEAAIVQRLQPNVIDTTARGRIFII